jgi:hypothetical protein
MFGAPFDSAAFEAKLDAKLDRIFCQLTTITNCLNSHDSRLARVETGKPNPSKGGEDTDKGAHTVRIAMTLTGAASTAIAPGQSSATAPFVAETAMSSACSV